MTIKEIVDNLAQHFSKPFDVPFKSRIKSEVISARAEVIKQHFQKYGTFPESLVSQMHKITMTSIDIAESDQIRIGINVSKSSVKIPTPIRMSGKNSNFIYVGTIDGRSSFSYIEPESFEDLKSDRFAKLSIYYSYINGYIYVYGSCPKNIRVRLIAANPYKIAELNGEVEEDCPQTLDIPEDFVNLIERMVIDIVQRGVVQPDDDEEIKVDENA